MSAHYKIAVLGPTVRDHITTCTDEVIEKYGGVNNPCIALAKLLDENSTIFPVTHVRNQDESAIKAILQPYANIDSQYISTEADQGDVIRLRFIDQNRRLEKMAGFMNPITPDDVKNLLDCDAFIMVPVTDFEISLETLKFIKEYSEALILFDAHGPTTTMTTLGDRLPKFWMDRDSWLPYIDILKMNLDEAKCTWFRKKYKLIELENEYEFEVTDLLPLARYCLNKGVKLLCVTLDGDGCMLYFKKDGQLQEEHVAAITMDTIVDTTGCGDSFAAGLVYGTLATGDYIKAAQFANAIGAQRTQGSDFEVFKSLAETEQMIKAAYGTQEENL